MKRFHCQCGQSVFFENFHCVHCGSLLGFDPSTLSLLTLEPLLHDAYRAYGNDYRLCRNRIDHELCNWLIRVDSSDRYCLACGLNAVIPNLTAPDNLQRWHRLEEAKRRLIYSLLSLGLPVVDSRILPLLTFKFMEDHRSNPLVEESFVATGHYAGVITINISEADDVTRHALRELMQERYRTLLGHFRHESGHFYYESLVMSHPAARDQFRQLFGNERSDYRAAIETHYRDKTASSDWMERFVSQYAASHPLEDWAETWSHYLHIADTLETATEWGVISEPEKDLDNRDWITRWLDLSVTLNELNRSLGMDDAYPFVFTAAITEKLEFVHQRVAQAILRRAG